MLRMISSSTVLICILANASLAQSAVKQAALDSGPQSAKTSGHGWGFDLASEDTSVKPGDNFFLYANGNYIKHLEIPADRTDIGLLSGMGERTQSAIHSLLEDQLIHGGSSPTEQKVAAFYEAFMDEDRIEQLDTEPLKADLSRVRSIRSKSQMSALMGSTLSSFGDSIFSPYVDVDPKDTTHYILKLYLGLPNRDFYLKPEFAEKKRKYQAYIVTMLTLGGWPDAERNAAGIVDFETRLAAASWSGEEERNPLKTYHLMTVIELAKMTPGFDMQAFLDAAGFHGVNSLDVVESTAIPEIVRAFAETSLETLKAWEAFTIIDQTGYLLPHRFVEARFEFRGHILSGQSALAPRWKRAVQAENRELGEAVGRMYVARYFTADSKTQMEQLVANLKSAFHDRLERATWMSDKTRAEALQKLDTMSVGIGYPSKWRTYDFEVTPTDLYGDVQRSKRWQHQENVALLSKPVDRQDWDLLPQSSFSDYVTSINRITFPAANLQVPFFDPTADAAINYGAIGVVIGHEMTHGFDDQGRNTDSTGRIRNWWTVEDADKFKLQADRLSQQYSSFEPLPGVHVNGPLTLGEDIADTGGVALALEAYHRSLKGQPAPILDGTTGDQRFFLSCAQVWAGKEREESIRESLMSDHHPPGEQRVNGEVRNIDAWYAAFDVRPGDKLYIAPEDRVHIW
jgi:putative endopeptidase